MKTDENSQVTTPTKSKHDLLKDRLHTKYPDKDLSDDENFYGQLSDDFDDYDKKLGEYQGREKSFSDMFTSDPRSASFITAWKNGEDPAIELIRRFGPELKDAIDNPEMLDKIAEANKDYVTRVEQSKKLNDEYEKNIKDTLQYLSDLQSKNKLEDSEIDDVMAFLIKIVDDGVLGKFTPETIEMARKAVHHDDDVIEADQAGEIRGRNAKIDEKLKQKGKGDGTAQLDGQNNIPPSPQKRRPTSVFDLAKLAK